MKKYTVIVFHKHQTPSYFRTDIRTEAQEYALCYLNREGVIKIQSNL